MKKQKIQIFILMVILVFCILGYFIIKNSNQNKEEVEDTSITVTDVASENVVEMEYIYDGKTITFIKENDTWYDKEDKSIPIMQSEITTMLNYACKITTNTSIPDAEDLSVYGLLNPANMVSLTLTDGSVVQLMIGDYLSITGEYYAKTAGDDTVYTIPSYCVAAFEKSVDDLTEVTETEIETTEE